MLERLDYVKITPRRILDAASGPPTPMLAKRYPAAGVIALDFALGMLRVRGWRRFFSRRAAICADLERLPIADGALDLIWCNMALHWLGDPLPALKEFRRVLGPQGLVMLSTLGPDTLKELRAVAEEGRVHDFIDMHDVGDMLLAAGFSAPVMDMETIRMAYAGATQLFDDLRNSGQTSARADRPRGLTGRKRLESLRARLPSVATYEVVYGHAWAGAPKANQDPKTVRVFKRMP